MQVSSNTSGWCCSIIRKVVPTSITCSANACNNAIAAPKTLRIRSLDGLEASELAKAETDESAAEVVKVESSAMHGNMEVLLTVSAANSCSPAPGCHAPSGKQAAPQDTHKLVKSGRDAEKRKGWGEVGETAPTPNLGELPSPSEKLVEDAPSQTACMRKTVATSKPREYTVHICPKRQLAEARSTTTNHGESSTSASAENAPKSREPLTAAYMSEKLRSAIKPKASAINPCPLAAKVDPRIVRKNGRNHWESTAEGEEQQQVPSLLRVRRNDARDCRAR
ncbi:hypothetical protein cyc_08356 [Cyclospora cayetanensis]|uniref:Uncharacterized protein n=1 Tax=Cyclospora cayetanensis TaxID=88456 RepID=A0A1D3D2D5_9EIME|nr:hypothetical protein cyc_08356 [Cyclospora cayetanensis]